MKRRSFLFKDVFFSYSPLLPSRLARSPERVVTRETFFLSIPHLEVECTYPILVEGPNGAGKSTFLKLCGGVLFPQKGVIFFEGVATSSLSPQRQHPIPSFIYVHPVPYLFKGTGYHNLLLPLTWLGIPAQEREQRIAEVTDLFNLESLLSRPYWAFSSGEAQRLSLGRALVARPKVLLLDEPTASLDTEGPLFIERLLWYAQKEDISLLFASHDTLIKKVCSTSVDISGFSSHFSIKKEVVHEKRSPSR
ncbi:MAG: ATP-binding cassette domain-containing protein [Treponemataceae bacterium]|nr:ATP-binding cassette domain-containing protein [Treponemataceae bacterium]